MTFLPKRLKRPKMNLRESAVIRCPSHLKWVRGHMCCIAGRAWEWVDVEDRTIYSQIHVCEGRMEAHHTPTRGAGGGDDSVVPLCSYAHALLDSPGWSEPRLEAEYKVDLRKIAAELWKQSPHGQRYRREHP